MATKTTKRDDPEAISDDCWQGGWICRRLQLDGYDGAPYAGNVESDGIYASRKNDLNLSGRGGKKIVILGAGIAGLTATYELGLAGYDCTILEAKSFAGGRNWTIRKGTSVAEIGLAVRPPALITGCTSMQARCGFRSFTSRWIIARSLA